MSKKTNAERLSDLFKKYGLDSEDGFRSPQGWKIITRSGIDKIQAGAKIDINYDLVVADVAAKTYVVKAIGSMGDRNIETYGEAAPGNTSQKYPVAMAEKRAMSRVVLKLAGFYEVGAMGMDEADDFAKVPKSERTPISELIQEKL